MSEPKIDRVTKRPGGGYWVYWRNGDRADWPLTLEAIRIQRYGYLRNLAELDAILEWLGEKP